MDNTRTAQGFKVDVYINGRWFVEMENVSYATACAYIEGCDDTLQRRIRDHVTVYTQ